MSKQSSDIRDMNRLYDLYDPWIGASIERIGFHVTLKSGRTVDLFIPLGAAVEIEEAGFPIICTTAI